LIAALAVLLGAALQSATGFGFALAAAPLLVAVLGPRVTVSTMVVLALVVTVLTLAGERRRPRIDRREALSLVGWSLPGLLIGVLVLRLVPERGLTVLVLASVIAAVLLRLRAPVRVRRWSPARAAATGMTSGVLSTSTGVGGPPIVFHLLARRLPAERMRDTLTVVWLAGGLLTGGVLLATGSLSLPDEMPVLVAATVAGQLAGRQVFALLGGERYERTVLGVLLVTALVALGMRIAA
jgi:uncharacterized membrane protein YfcA